MSFIPRVTFHTHTTATSVTNPTFGKSKGNIATLRMEFHDPLLRDRAYHVAVSRIQPSCCCSGRYTSITVSDGVNPRIVVWVNHNSFKKRLANPQGYFVFNRFFPEDAIKLPIQTIYEAHSIRFPRLPRTNSAPLPAPRVYERLELASIPPPTPLRIITPAPQPTTTLRDHTPVIPATSQTNGTSLIRE